MWTENFQMFKLVLEKAEEPEIKLPTSAGSSKKQEGSRKTSISALLTTQGWHYNAISAKGHPGDQRYLFWCVMRVQNVVSWRKWDFTCKTTTERYICRVVLEKEKDALNNSLPLYMPRDIILDWVSLAGSLATAPLSWPTLECWRWSLYELEMTGVETRLKLDRKRINRFRCMGTRHLGTPTPSSKNKSLWKEAFWNWWVCLEKAYCLWSFKARLVSWSFGLLVYPSRGASNAERPLSSPD